MKRGTGWPIAIAAVLGITVVANFAVLYVAGNDPSFVVEPDYYQKAMHYDEEIAQERRNQQLGWLLVPTVAPLRPAGADVTVRLTDARGMPLTGVRVHVAAVYNARAADVLGATLSPRPDSEYTGRLPMRHTGEWELRFEAVRGSQRFTAVRRVDVPAAAGGS